MKRATLILSTLLISPTLFAGGYRVSLQGQKALGMGHTGVAMAESAEVVFFNPAGMTQLENELELIAGLTLVDSTIAYQNSDTNASVKTDNPLGTPINLYISKKQSDQLSYGLGIYTPYGNTVKYEDDWAGSHLVNNITLKAIYVQPTIAYQINDTYSIGGGPTLAIGEVEFNKNLTTALVDENGDRANVTISEDGITEWGYNIGLFSKVSNDFSWGVSYRSEITMKARGGKADFENIPTSMATTYPDATFDADLVLPAELNIGFSYKTSKATTFAFELNRAYWSSYKSLDINISNGVKTINARNYQDADTFRFGVQHDHNDDLTLRAGIYFDNTPVQDGYFAPETPRNDAVGYTLGATYKVQQNLELDFSFLVLKFDEIDASYDHILQTDGSSQSFAGSYHSQAITYGFGLNYLF
ncbi:MAG: outer membrane protein transport protein [Gammaproteobacteria bacterium]|nr:outer membrane protein transport protein [Gammaproteobacteria bacterium]